MEEPELLPGEDFYLEAFTDLSTERNLGMSIGPIPWNSIVLYAKQKHLDEENAQALVTVIRIMDNAYLEFASEEMKKRRGAAGRNNG